MLCCLKSNRIGKKFKHHSKEKKTVYEIPAVTTGLSESAENLYCKYILLKKCDLQRKSNLIMNPH